MLGSDVGPYKDSTKRFYGSLRVTEKSKNQLKR